MVLGYQALTELDLGDLAPTATGLWLLDLGSSSVWMSAQTEQSSVAGGLGAEASAQGIGTWEGSVKLVSLDG